MTNTTSDFDQFVYQTLAKKAHHAFLIVLLDKKDVVGGKIAIRVVGTLIENCVSGFDFQLFKEHMTQSNQTWDLAAVCLGNNADGSAPNLDDCKRWLENMEQRIASGDMQGMMVFDNKGMEFNGLGRKANDMSTHGMYKN